MKVLVISLLLLAAFNAAAQNSVPVIRDNTNGSPENDFTIGEVRGSVRRKAVYLPKPPFPREALEAGADGAVRVEVMIDAEGSVASAKAVSGNPLLFAAAEETARKTKFRRADDGSETENAFITYNFAIEKASWLRIGYDLAVVQKAPTLRPLNVPRLIRAFAPEWSGEIEMLNKLAEMRRVEIETQNAAVPDRPIIVRKSIPSGGGARQSEMRAQLTIPQVNPPTPERIALAQNLSNALRARLAGDEANLWKFDLGADLSEAMTLSRNPAQARDAAIVLRRSLDNAPAGTPAEALAALRDLIGIFESGRRTPDTMNEIGRAMSVIFRIK